MTSVVVASSGAYRIGELSGLALLAVLFLALVARALDVRLHRSPAPVLAPGLSQSSSAPVATVRMAPRRRRTDALAAVVVGALLIGGILQVGDGSAHSASAQATSAVWSTPQGRELRAGFMAGCERSAAGAVDCRCVFARLTRHSPYDTLGGFMTLVAPVHQFEQTRNAGLIPSALIDSVRSCQH